MINQCNYRYSNTFSGRCYFGNAKRLNWHSALRYCRQHNGYLADVDSDAENTAVVNVFQSSRELKVAWIGFNDISKEGKWVWQLKRSSRNVVPYTNWLIKQPDNSNDEDCTEITLRTGVYQSGNKGVWNDNDCITYRAAAVCEKGQ